MPTCLHTVAAISLLVTLGAAQQWAPLRSLPHFRTAAGMAQDPATGRAMLFGGYLHTFVVPHEPLTDDFWRWAGDGWELVNAVSPPARTRPAMATDLLRKRLVLHGGRDAAGNPLNDTWEWDGRAWLQRTTSVAPPAFGMAACAAYDLARGRTVLWGSTNQPIASTWEWDGTAWTPMVVPNPPPRFGAAIAHDLVRARTVLFGGTVYMGTNPIFVDETWEYDGIAWQLATPLSPPPARNYAAMAYDENRARIVLFGGTTGNADLSDTYEYDGVSWSLVTVPLPPPAQAVAAMAFDVARARTVLSGRRTVNGGGTPVTWEFDGVAWHEQSAPPVPPARARHAVAPDVVDGWQLLFGGACDGQALPQALGDTWRFDGDRWQQAVTPVAPPARNGTALALDTVRGRVVLFGGADGTTTYADTWEWDGAAWTQAQPAMSPPPRRDHAMAHDAARGTTVLFGGHESGVQLGDTWTWSGTTWTQRLVSGPVARLGHAMAFDSLRQVVVLFGGTSVGVDRNDVWQWDGTSWQQRPAIGVQPPPRSAHGLAYDASIDRLVVHGGSAFLARDNTWEWNGTAGTWTQTVASSPLRSVNTGTMVYDPRQQRIFLFDGFEPWAYSRSLAAATNQGSGCGPALVPELRAMGRPFLGNAGFRLAIEHGPAGAPAVVGAAFAPGVVQLPGGCTLLLGNPMVWGFGVLDPLGTASLLLPIHGPARARGVPLLAQAVLLAPSPAPGLATTNAVRLLLGD